LRAPHQVAAAIARDHELRGKRLALFELEVSRAIGLPGLKPILPRDL